MLDIKGVDKLLSVNPHLKGIEEWDDRYRLHLNDSKESFPLLFDIFRTPIREGDEVSYSIRINCITEDVFMYDSFPLSCSLKTFSDIPTFTTFLGMVIQTWNGGTLSGHRLGVNEILPTGRKLGEWGAISYGSKI